LPVAGVVRPLSLGFACISVTVGVVDDVLLVDPSEQEERALQGSVTCVFAMPGGSLCYLRQVGSTMACLHVHSSLTQQPFAPPQSASARFGKAQLTKAVACCAAQAAALYAGSM
jgi:exosome complex RNA-binding protein Rrp42 (RNase PH superfamily)